MQEKLGKIVHNGEIYDLDDVSSIDKLEKLLAKLDQEEKEIKREIEEYKEAVVEIDKNIYILEHIKNKKRPKKENIAAAMPIRKGVVRKMFS